MVMLSIVMAAKKKPEKRPRAQRRAEDRAQGKLFDASERLFKLEPGGSPDRPIELAAASQVEIEAEARPCPRCRGRLKVLEHAARTVGGDRLRVAQVSCGLCRFHGAMYFRLRPSLPN